MRLLIGIDDTDNSESRGTGFRARLLAGLIESNGLGKINGITRHQLFIHPAIAYTSHNSSACLDVEAEGPEKLKPFCIEFLTQEAADGSDAGLCIAEWKNIPEEILEWGHRAKKEVLQLEEGCKLASETGIYLEGFTGTYIGQIGALAAVGLRKGGNDGRFIWLKGTRELRDFDAGIYTVGELEKNTGIDLISTIEGIEILATEKINCEGWTRPVLMNNNAVLLVEKCNFADYGWKTIAKEYIRSIT